MTRLTLNPARLLGFRIVAIAASSAVTGAKAGNSGKFVRGIGDGPPQFPPAPGTGGSAGYKSRD